MHRLDIKAATKQKTDCLTFVGSAAAKATMVATSVSNRRRASAYGSNKNWQDNGFLIKLQNSTLAH